MKELVKGILDNPGMTFQLGFMIGAVTIGLFIAWLLIAVAPPCT